jgi:hypothetical protein
MQRIMRKDAYEYDMVVKEPKLTRGEVSLRNWALNPDLRIHVYQMINLGRINYTVGVEIPKKYLGKVSDVRREQ